MHYRSRVTIVLSEQDLSDSSRELLLQQERVAVDTETSGLDWRRDSLDLCQVFAPDIGGFLVRNPTERSRNLRAVLEATPVVKIFHHAPFDLRFLRSACEIDVASVYCTKAASRISDPELDHRGHSLQSLLHRHLAIDIEKGSVRTSDWGAAQLSEPQLQYALADVEHLPRLAEVLTRRLTAVGRDSDFRAVCVYMPTAARLEVLGISNPLEY